MLHIANHWRKVFIPVLLCLLLTITACTPKASSPYSEIQKETSRRGAPAAVAKTAEQGATFNQFFPNGTRGYEVIPTQEKKGFAEYKVLKDGKTVAMLSISDTSSIPAATAKYRSSDLKIANYPAADQGTNATGLLINDRYQIKVLSRDSSFTRDDRIAWLQKFDLRGLAKLKSASSVTAVPALPTSPTAQPAPGTRKPVLQPAPKIKQPVLQPAA
jgi:hypothetical protein